METIITPVDGEPGGTPATSHRGRSAASWGAIIAGAFVAISTTLILLALGAGLGFAAISPWSGDGVTAKTFAITTAIWLIVTQWISALLGGYIAGRLRTRWLGTHPHEVFFRDTAHGLVAWSLATVVVASLAGSSITALWSGGVHAATTIAAGAATGAAANSSMAESRLVADSRYGVDRLYRAAPDSPGSTSDYRAETAQILASSLATGSMSAEDRTYLIGLVAQKTGVAPEEAQRRVDELTANATEAANKARAAADTARKAAAQAAIYTALSLLIGAFIASVAAAIGGRLRDEHI